MREDREHTIKVKVSRDSMSASLVIPPNVNRATITPAFRDALLKQARIPIDDRICRAFDEALQKPAEPGQTLEAVIAEGQHPAHGQDGRVEWFHSQSDEQPKEGHEGGTDEPANFYEFSAFQTVEEGQTLGRLIPPTPGVDGRDIYGQHLPAKDGVACSFKTDDTLYIKNDGSIVANRGGLLSITRHRAVIRNCLRIDKNVDFSTGNIDFDGDVLINRDVRDRFQVRSGGNISVGGLIEAAEIECDGDLIAHGGFIGRGRGKAIVGGDLHARYLDSIQATVRGDIHVRREILHSELTIRGDLYLPHGSIIGGTIHVTGKADVRALGAEAGTHTHIHIGTVPHLEPLLQNFDQLIEQYNAARDADLAERKKIVDATGSRKLPRELSDRLIGLVQHLEKLGNQLDQAVEAREQLAQKIEAQRTFDLRVHQQLYAGVRIITPDTVFTIRKDVPGPLHITRDDDGNLIYTRNHGGGGLIGQIADMKIAA